MELKLEYPETLNCAEYLIDRHVREGRGDRVAVYYEEWPLNRPDGKATYRDLMELTNKFGRALRDLGLEYEDRIGIMMYDSLEYLVSFFGAVKIGAIPVPIPTMLTPEEVKYRLEDSAAKAFVVYEEFAELARELRGKLRHLKHVIVIGKAPEGMLSYDELMEKSPPELDIEPTHKDDMCFFLYSSGTTGAPKGVVHYQHDMLAIAESNAVAQWKATENDVFLATWRAFFAAGLGGPSAAWPFYVGAATVMWPGNPPGRLVPEDFARLVEKYKVTILGGVPTFFMRWLTSEEAMKYDLSSLRLTLSGAEPTPPSLYKEWKEKVGCELHDTVGSTETLHSFLCSQPGSDHPGLRPYPGWKVKLVDEEGREITEPGKPGSLLLSFDSATNLYWRKHEKTKATFQGEWINLGDNFYMDEKGYFWYLGRADEMIKQRGMWVSPKKVEDAVVAHPAVLMAAAVQSYTPDEGLPIVKLFVVLKEGYRPSPEIEAQIMDICKEKLASWERPQVIEFVEDLPRLSTGKVSRLLLKQREDQKLLEMRRKMEEKKA